MKRIKGLFTLLFALSIVTGAEAGDDTGRNLAKFATDPNPWMHIAANSEQRQPLYFGTTPREMALRRSPADNGQLKIYDLLRERGEAQIKQVRDGLVKSGSLGKGQAVEFEMWPVRDDYGQLTWMFARWRTEKGKPWQRLNASILPANPDPYRTRWPMLPISLNPADKDDFARIFDDALAFKSLYDKPLLGDCVWATSDGIALDAWLPVEQREAFGREVADDIKKLGSGLVCRVLPQPPRLNGKPITFIVRLEGDDVAWPGSIWWKEEDTALPAGAEEKPVAMKWPDNFIGTYKNDLLTIAGEKEAIFPVSARAVTFKKKNSAEKDNQLQDLVAYLEERYKALGIKTWRQDFSWRDLPQTNLIAVIPGTDPSLKPVLLADHIDTAFCEDIFESTGRTKRVSAPGADDNASATAALLGAAPILRDLKLRRPVWLVHLTGEEFPADDLGARHFVSQLLKDKQDIEGLVLLDMIGHREKGDNVFQVNAGDTPGSLRMARMAMDSAKGMAGPEPVLRTRFDEKSYLYNTDGLIFSDAGFPVICLNEHINKIENMYRKGYHHSADTSKSIDWDYAAGIAKAAISTVAALANAQPAARAPAARPDWSIIVYAGVDEPDLARVHNPRLKELLETPLPDNVEVMIGRDTEWPDGFACVLRTNDSHEEVDLAEQNSANAETLENFLKLAAAKTRGKNKLLIIQGSSWGWRGIIRDHILPGEQGKKAVMPLGGMAGAIRESGFKPGVIVLDASLMGNVEPIEELKGLAPYLVVSELGMPRSGFPAERLFKIAAEPDMSARKLARRLPEEYVKEYAHDGPMAVPEGRYFTVAMASIDTAKWDAFAEKFKRLVDALAESDFRRKLAAQPGWLWAFADDDMNADLVEFLNRLPLLIEDPAARRLAGEILDDIGYPDSVAADNASTVTLDPSKVRSFELRIEAYPHLKKEKALSGAREAWNRLNQDLNLPDTFTYDISEFTEKRDTKREFIVRCTDGALKRPVTFRVWLPGAQYAVLTTVDKDGRVAERKFFRDKDYLSVQEFPEKSFLVSEAHAQGAPFIHGIGICIDPGMKAEAESVSYAGTAWNNRTGWGSLMSAVPAKPALPQPAPEPAGEKALSE